MLGLLVALVLLALAVCAVVPPLAVVAGMVAAIAPCSSVRTDCAVAARSAGDTARSGREDQEGRARGGPVRAAEVVPGFAAFDSCAGCAGGSLTVAHFSAE